MLKGVDVPLEISVKSFRRTNLDGAKVVLEPEKIPFKTRHTNKRCSDTNEA